MSDSTPPAPPAPFQLAAPVPFLLWDTFEEALRINIRRLAKDIGATIGKSEAPLLDAILKGGKATIRPYIFEEAGSDAVELDMRCDFLCQLPSAPHFLQPCRQPVVWAAATAAAAQHHRCAEHLYSRAEKLPAGLPVMRPVIVEDGEAAGAEAGGHATLYVASDGLVYDADNILKGRYEADEKTLTFFEVLEEEPAAGPPVKKGVKKCGGGGTGTA